MMLFASAALGVTAGDAPTPAPDLNPPETIVLGHLHSREGEQWHRAAYAQYKKAIEAELAKEPGPDWAGRYGASARYESQEFMVAPSGLFVKNHTSDVAGFFSGQYGTAQLVEGQFVLRLAPGVDQRDGRPFVPGPYFVAWGDKRYAVEPADMLVFVNAVNAMGNPAALCAGAGFKCVAMNRTAPATPLSAGLPVLPPPWGSFLLKMPVEARVLERMPYTTTVHNEYRLVKTRLVIDKGVESGLKPGMTLHFKRTRGFGSSTVTVERVERDTTLVEFSDFGDSEIYQYGPPAIGQMVSSRAIPR